MNLNVIGMNTSHDENFVIERPYGSGDNLFILYKTEATVYTGQESIHVYPGSCIVYRHGSPQHYTACGKKYMNHFIHFNSCGDGIFATYNIPADTPFYLRNIEEIEAILRLISREQISTSLYRNANADLLLQLLFQKLAENQCDSPYIPSDLKHYEELTGLRSVMYSTPRKYSSVPELARDVNISLSHFQALYHSYFGVSCYDDLMNAKLANAKNYLVNSSLSVKEISALCGYENDTCFMRCFKKKNGLTPTEYRKQNRIPNVKERLPIL